MSLPSGYTKLDYIESHGTEYFDTGFVPDSNTRVVMDIENLATSVGYFFGACTTLSTYSYSVPVTQTTRFRSDYCSDVESRVAITLDDALGRYTIDKNKNVCSVNDITVTNTELTFECAYSLYLLCQNRTGEASTFSTVKLYSCQIYDNGTLIRDFIPCLNASGTVGLWDDVNSVFYENAGSGTLSYYISKKHKTLIDGTGYEIKSGRVLIDGTGYSIKKGRTLIDGTGYDIGFGTPVGELDVGTSVYMDVDGVRTEFLVVHQGIGDSNWFDSTSDGTWLLIKDIYTEIAYGNKYYYQYSTLDSYANNDFYNKLDSGIQELIKQVNLILHIEGATISRKIFSLNRGDVGFDYISGESYTPLDYFDEGTTTAAKNKRIAYYNGSANSWWLSDLPNEMDDVYYGDVISSAGTFSYNAYNLKCGFRPAFILPSDDARFDDDFNIIIP